MRAGKISGGLAVAALTVGAALVGPGAVTARAQSVCDDPMPPDWCTDNPGGNPEGSLDSVRRAPGGVEVSGWATDVNGGPVRVKFSVGGTAVGSLTADSSGGFGGFLSVPSATGTVCATAVNIGSGFNTPLGCSSLSVGHDPVGAMDSWRVEGNSIVVTGWAIDPDSSAQTSVYVQYGGQTYGPFPANQPRADVGAANPGYGNDHGYAFSFTPPVISNCYNYLNVIGVNIGAGADKRVGGWFCS
ncbi:hypothetical protein ACIA8O_13450 [Kitasatospora sp. NPDC051853]|uniref:hypothetical protein n=1 Tax=Kitasatospora sp. NPDC051853 TaxID=3364058 RepID=UPI0037887034